MRLKCRKSRRNVKQKEDAVQISISGGVVMADTIIEAIMKNIDVIDTLNNIEIITDFKIEKDELVKKLEENRPTQKEIDDMSDSSQKEVTPDEFRKKKI